MKKKLLTLILVAAMVLTFAACGKETDKPAAKDTPKETPPESVKIVSLKGPTSMGLVDYYHKLDEEENKTVEYEIASAPDQVVAGITKGDIDIACVPANMASILYNKSEGKLLQITNINTLGVIYLASTDENIKSFDDLKGQKIIMAGKGATPEFALKALLKKKGLDPETDVTLDFKSENTEVIGAMAQGEGTIALMPQPFLTVAKSKLDIKNVISLNDEWKETFGEGMITGVTVVNKEFAKKYPEFVKDFMKKYSESVKFTNDNPADAAKLIGEYDIVKAPIAEKAIPHCNIVFIEGEEMAKALGSYYEIMYGEDPASVGGNVPGEDIYYYTK